MTNVHVAVVKLGTISPQHTGETCPEIFETTRVMSQNRSAYNKSLNHSFPRHPVKPPEVWCFMYAFGVQIPS